MAISSSTTAAASTGWPRGTSSFEQKFGNATTRVVVGAIGIPIVLGTVWLGGWAFFLFMIAVCTGALLEFYWIVEAKGARPNKVLGVVFGLLLAFAFMHGVSDRLLLGMSEGEPTDMAVMLARFALVIGVLLLFTIAVMISEMRRADASPVANNTATIAGVAYVSLFLSSLIGLRQLFSGDLPMTHYLERINPELAVNSDHFGGYTVLAILVSIWTCDSAAYYAGRAFGKHKLAEKISPKKTWEGAVAGALFAVLAMVGFQQWLLPYLRLGDAVVIGIFVGVFGQLGDLAESHLKRDAGVKDSSHLIPGHGGIFDRFDSLLFVSPLVYIYINFLMLLR